MKKFLSFYLLLFVAISSYAQSASFVPETRTCGTMDHFHRQAEEHPSLLHHKDAMNQEIADWLEANPNFNETRATYTMPIVFHVVYNTAVQNVSDELIMSQLEQINDDFQAMNDDINTVPAEFPVGNVDIEFCLATVDPDGNATSGITRTQTSTNSFSTNDNVKFTNSGGIDAWDTNKYFNVWICSMGGGILGYGQFPFSFATDPDTDGLVLGYYTVGSQDNPNPAGGQFGGGRTATHELGHCLGLFHIWGDDGGACNNAGDNIADTPDQGDASSGCPNYPTSSCGSNDMTMNYMDYSNDACLTAFTPGQADMIAAQIATYQYLQNKVAAAGQVCSAVPPTASINGPSSGCAPLDATFTDNSSGGATSWSWTFPGGVPASFNGQNPPTVTYATPGNYTATLVVTNDEGSDTGTLSVEVVDCNSLTCNTIDNLNGGTITLIEDTDSDDGGYVAGHNGFEDAAKAEYFTDLGGANFMDGVGFDFGYADGSGSVEFVIWEDDNGTPGLELATQSIPVSTIIADVNANNDTWVDFGGVINIPSSFFAGFKVDYGSHTLGLNTNSDGDSPDNTAYELWSNGDWYPFDDGTGSNTTWELQVSMAIYPNVCVADAANQAPNANFTTSVMSQGCETIQIQYMDNSSNTPTGWDWSFPGGDPATSTDENPVVVYTSAGSYSATLTASNANGNNTITQTDIIVVPSPLVAGTLDAMEADLAVSGLVDFMDNTAGATTWDWDFGDGVGTATGQNASYTYTAVGVYTVTLTVSDGFCTETITTTVTVTDTTGVEDIEGLSSMNIRPNPVSDKFFIELVSSENLELQIEIFDATGRKVVNGGTISVMGTVNHPVDATQLAAGTYFVRIISGSNTATTKVLKF